MEVSFGTGPSLRQYDYAMKCTFPNSGGCEAPAVGQTVTGQTTRIASTIVGEVTGLDALVQYQCYVIVSTDKVTKCQPVDTPILSVVTDASMAALSVVRPERAGPTIESYYLQNISSATSTPVTISGSGNYNQAYTVSLSGEVLAVVITSGGASDKGLWYTTNITAYNEIPAGCPFPCEPAPFGFQRLSTAGDIGAAFTGLPPPRFQISGDRMVAWDLDGNLILAADWTANTWTRMIPIAQGQSSNVASVTGDMVAQLIQDGPDYFIALYTNGFEDPSVDLDAIVIPIQPEDPSGTLQVTGISLSGPFLAYATFFEGATPADKKSQIWYIDLRVLQEDPLATVEHIEVPAPADFVTSGASAKLIVATIASNQMVVSYDTFSSSPANNAASTRNFLDVTADEWFALEVEIGFNTLGFLDYIPGSLPL